MKICFTASSGGHFEQLKMLSPLMHEYDCFVLTEKTVYSAQITNIKTYYLKQLNRKEFTFIPRMLTNIFVSLYVFAHEKPDIVISTGVLATIPICIIAKLFHNKLIYIESFAKVTTGTQTGKFLYPFADRFYVQWESMLKVFPAAIFIGGIY